MSSLPRLQARRHPRRPLPPPIDYLLPELRAASQRCDELLGPALAMIDERRRLARRAKLIALVGIMATVYLVLRLHPDWQLSHWLL